jgi:hypothetical protein
MGGLAREEEKKREVGGGKLLFVVDQIILGLWQLRCMFVYI